MISTENICQIGSVFPKIRSIPYLSQYTFMDHDVLILNYEDGINQTWDQSQKKQFLKRKNDLEEFLTHKKVPLIVFAPQSFLRYFSDQSVYKPSFALPAGEFEVEAETGEKIEVLKGTCFTNFFEKYIHLFGYSSVFTKFEGKSILETPHTRKVVGFYNQNAIFLPRLKIYPEHIDEFLYELVYAAKQVKNGKNKSELPQWASHFFLPSEKELINNISDLQEKIAKYSDELKKTNEKIENLKNRKVLFTGSGNELEKVIEDLFIELGFEIIESDRNRDDLIIKYGDKIAVVEIKGINSSAAEKHANQLEKWVSLYFEKNDVRPKGILIVNSFKDKPLSERTELTFPDQMLKYSVNREHCLISSLQFLGLYYKAINSSNKDEIINSLFDTIGVYDGFKSWHEFIEE